MKRSARNTNRWSSSSENEEKNSQNQINHKQLVRMISQLATLMTKSTYNHKSQSQELKKQLAQNYQRLKQQILEDQNKHYKLINQSIQKTNQSFLNTSLKIFDQMSTQMSQKQMKSQKKKIKSFMESEQQQQFQEKQCYSSKPLLSSKQYSFEKKSFQIDNCLQISNKQDSGLTQSEKILSQSFALDYQDQNLKGVVNSESLVRDIEEKGLSISQDHISKFIEVDGNVIARLLDQKKWYHKLELTKFIGRFASKQFGKHLCVWVPPDQFDIHYQRTTQTFFVDCLQKIKQKSKYIPEKISEICSFTWKHKKKIVMFSFFLALAIYVGYSSTLVQHLVLQINRDLFMAIWGYQPRVLGATTRWILQGLGYSIDSPHWYEFWK